MTPHSSSQSVLGGPTPTLRRTKARPVTKPAFLGLSRLAWADITRLMVHIRPLAIQKSNRRPATATEGVKRWHIGIRHSRKTGQMAMCLVSPGIMTSRCWIWFHIALYMTLLQVTTCDDVFEPASPANVHVWTRTDTKDFLYPEQSEMGHARPTTETKFRHSYQWWGIPCYDS